MKYTVVNKERNYKKVDNISEVEINKNYENIKRNKSHSVHNQNKKTDINPEIRKNISDDVNDQNINYNNKSKVIDNKYKIKTNKNHKIKDKRVEQKSDIIVDKNKNNNKNDKQEEKITQEEKLLGAINMFKEELDFQEDFNF